MSLKHASTFDLIITVLKVHFHHTFVSAAVCAVYACMYAHVWRGVHMYALVDARGQRLSINPHLIF